MKDAFVDTIGKKVENQVQFWSLLGPFFVLLSIAVLLFKVSPHWYFPISALIGIPLCVKWKMKGMALALGCLFLLAGVSYQDLDFDDRYWYVGLSLAMAFSFIVLTLSLEEVDGLVGKLQLESQSRLDNFLLLDEKWKIAEQGWLLEKEKSKAEIAALMQEVAKIQEDKQIFYKLAQLAKDELVQVRGQHDQLLQDLLYKKQQFAQLHERLEETEITLQGFVNSDAERQIQTLTERLTNLEREREIFKAKIALVQEENQACQIEKEQLWRDLQACQESEKLCLIEQQHFQQDKQDQQNIVQALQNKCALIEEHLLYQEQQAKQREEQYKLAQQQLQKQLEEEKHRADMQLRQNQQQALLQGQQEIKALQERYHKVREDLARAHEDLDMTNDALNHLRQKEEYYKTSMQRLQEQLEEQKKVEECFKQSQLGQNRLTEEIKALQERYQAAQEELMQIRQDLEAKNAALTQFQEKVEKLSNELCEQQSLIKQSAEQKQRLENLKLQLEQALQQTQEQLQQTKQKLDASQQQHYREQLPNALGNKRQIESMYMQLKEQFQEKCDVLDATRRELFHANEELLKCKREYEEEHLFGQSANEYHLQRYILQLGKQFEQMQKLYQQEIDDLTLLVGHLLQG
jgi:chromosome segregation ATPase